jgi:hypothetical protein
VQEYNPEATLEPNIENLNLKKFDLAFDIDPLFQKTSAKFDEGGAHGMLLNTLSVYRGCEILFDSNEVPDEHIDNAPPPPEQKTVGRVAAHAPRRVERANVLPLVQRAKPADADRREVVVHCPTHPPAPPLHTPTCRLT